MEFHTTTNNLQPLRQRVAVLADAHTKNKVDVFYLVTAATQVEGFKSGDNVQTVPDSSASTARKGKIAGDYVYNCYGKTVTLRLEHKEGLWILDTPSGTLSMFDETFFLDLLQYNGQKQRLRADLDRLLCGIAYRELGDKIEYGGNDQSLKKSFDKHLMLQEKPK